MSRRSTTYVFDGEAAEHYGLNEAILLNAIQWWIRYNKVHHENLHEGKTWTYNSVRAWAIQFPFFSERQIRTALQSLVDQGVLVVGRFNRISFDRTLWYAFASEDEWLGNAAHFTPASDASDEQIDLPPASDENSHESQMTTAPGVEPIPESSSSLQEDSGSSPSAPEAPRRSVSKRKIAYNYDTKMWEGITQADVDFWQDDFDGVDVVRELKRMKAWLDSHPKKKDFKRFIANWFLRAQTSSTVFATDQRRGGRR